MPKKKDVVQFLIPANETQLISFLEHQQNKSAVIRAMLFILLENKGETHDWTSELQDRRWHLVFDDQTRDIKPKSSTEITVADSTNHVDDTVVRNNDKSLPSPDEADRAKTDKSQDWREVLAEKHRLQSE